MNRIVAAQGCVPSELRSQVSNKLRLFLTCALGNLRRNFSMMNRKMNGVPMYRDKLSQVTMNRNTKVGYIIIYLIFVHLHFK